MSPLRLTVFFVVFFGVVAQRPTNEEFKKQQAADNAKAAGAAADQSKMGAVDKVVTLLEDLQKKVLSEGEAEAATYNKFACVCKTDQSAKSDAIKDEKDAKASLTADINKLMSGRAADDKKIKGLEKDIKDANDNMEKKMKANAKALKTYNEEKADLSGAISAIGNAIKTLKASKPSLLQLKSVAKTVREYMVMADALGLGADTLQGPMAAFLQGAPDVEMENYKFHSGGVIDTLEGLQKQFRTAKAESDAAEVERLQEHDMHMQQKTDLVKAKTVELEDTQKAKSDKIAEIADNSQKLTTESANLLDDQMYLDELYRVCKNKAVTWDTRSKVRADELSAITAAIVIVKGAVSEKTAKGTLRFAQRGVSVRLAQAVAQDENAMEAVEASTEESEAQSSSLSFLQRRLVSRHQPGSTDAVNMISALLRNTASKTKSMLLTSLALKIGQEGQAPKGMEKIKTLIEELINRLQKEASAEATQKGWCDKSLTDATTKRVGLTSTVNELNDSLAKLEADRQLLADMLDDLAKDIKELKKAQKTADDTRKEEKAENKATVEEAEAGQKAVESAIKVLADFYNKAAKNEDKKFEAKKEAGVKTPDAGFGGGEAYQGDQSTATGVLGMLDVIKSDFVRTVKETGEAESQGDQDHQAFTKATQTSLKEKESIEKARTKEKDNADSDFNKQKDSMKQNMDRLASNVEELLELKKTCVDTGMSYEERVARREEEIGSLRKALCILSRQSDYGAEGAASYDNC